MFLFCYFGLSTLQIIATDNHPVRWTTPLGLPVVQPYCRSERHLVSVSSKATQSSFIIILLGANNILTNDWLQIRTSLQVLALQREGNTVKPTCSLFLWALSKIPLVVWSLETWKDFFLIVRWMLGNKEQRFLQTLCTRWTALTWWWLLLHVERLA